MNHETTAPVQSLHDQIMRLPCDPAEYTNVNMMLAYKSGHRDARHAAAELAAVHEVEQAAPVAVPAAYRDNSRVPDDYQNAAAGYRAGWNDCRAADPSAPTPPAQQSQWVPVSERLPVVKKGDVEEVIVAVRRARNGKVYVFTTCYLNGYLAINGDEDSDDEHIALTGWYYESDDGEFWNPTLQDGDELIAWMPLPAAPGDTAAPELARHQLSAEDLAQVRAAAKESLLATILPGGAMALLNDGSEPDYSHLNCPACGGSGHIDDVQDAAPEQAEQQCPQCAGTGYDCPDCIQAAEQDAVAVPAGITIDRDLMGTMHIKCGDFDFIQIQYQYPYTDNASTRRLAEQIAALLGGDA